MNTLANNNDRAKLLELARESVGVYLETETKLRPLKKDYHGLFLERLGCFVTLHIDNNLRGCIGNIRAVYPLYEGIVENAYSAAFQDPRFSPLTVLEFEKVDFEISILSEPKLINYASSDELLSILQPGVDGVILDTGNRQSTFLPQVWDQLPDKVSFLEHLSRKQGSPANIWMESSTKVLTYNAEVFSEHFL